MIDLTQEQLSVIRGIVDELFPEYTVYIFGSRMTHTSRQTSDLDLAVEAPKKIPLHELSEVKERFTESDLPFSVDIVDINRVSGNFKKLIFNSPHIDIKKCTVV